MNSLPQSVNYHFWQPCNMGCKFCFAGFEDTLSVVPKGYLPKAASLALNRLLAQNFQKITYVGGEPTLCPWLFELLEDAKALGATTMIVSNGTKLSPEYLEQLAKHLDWLTISIDSLDPEVNRATGRTVNGKPLSAAAYIRIFQVARALGMRLKINTVVTSKNVHENISEFIKIVRPERWKIFQVLPIEGENNGKVEEFLIETPAFQAYIEKHLYLEQHGIKIAPEDNEDMLGSYAMVNPAGQFFDNSLGKYQKSLPILEVGIEKSWQSVHFDHQKFVERGGVYQWK